MAHHYRFDGQGRVRWFQFALLVCVALVVLCLLIGDQIDCRPKEDEGAEKDDGDKSNGEDEAGTKDDDEDKKKGKARKIVLEKIIADADEEKSDDGRGDKKERKNSSNKATKEIKKLTIAITTTTSAPSSSGENGTSTTPADKHGDAKKHAKKHGKKHPTGHHRVSGGFRETDIPDYLATLWQHKDVRPGTDGRYVGNGLLIGDGHMLIHSESKSKLDKPDIEGDPPDHEDIIFNNPTTIDVEEGISSKKRFRDIDSVKTGIGGSPFGLYTIKNRPPIDFSGYPDLPKKFPTLEHDYNNYGTNCNAYGWSRNLGAADPDSGGEGGSHRMRPFVKIPVEHNQDSCQNGHCELSSDHGGFCDGLGDYGTPVLCGEKKVLTFIIKGIDASTDGVGCRRGLIPAFHVGSMMEELKELVPGIKHT